jgi:cytochrome c-type biogenesis protein
MAGQIPVAFLAGLVSFVAPCVLPLVPGYLSAVSAVEAGQLGERATTKRVLVRSLPFVAGFTHVMGPFRWLRDHYVAIRTVSGAFLVAIGLLLFFDRIWWLSIGFNRALDAVGLH